MVTSNGKAPTLVVVQLAGGNDFMNTVIPYTNGLYYDYRPTVKIAEETVLPINDELAFNPSVAPLKELYDAGDMAIIQGVGYANSSRSHFRGMDIWHTCEPTEVATSGWVGKAIRDLDPDGANSLTAINFGRGLPRSMVAADATATSIGDLDTYGLMTGVEAEGQRTQALDLFRRIYTPAIGSGLVQEYLARTGVDVLRGAEILKQGIAGYASTIEFADNPIAKSLRDVSRVHIADLGTRIFYTHHGGYDTHANEVPTHPKLLTELSGAIRDFFQDLKDHNASENVVMLVFTEFGRRVQDNHSGTDHGAGGGAFVIGDRVSGGLHAAYPSLEAKDLEFGDLRHTFDFRGLYASLLEQWMGLDSTPIVGGNYEQLPLVSPVS
jgi:uncharacterized protein (DUF1501 family)